MPSPNLWSAPGPITRWCYLLTCWLMVGWFAGQSGQPMLGFSTAWFNMPWTILSMLASATDRWQGLFTEPFSSLVNDHHWLTTTSWSLIIRFNCCEPLAGCVFARYSHRFSTPALFTLLFTITYVTIIVWHKESISTIDIVVSELQPLVEPAVYALLNWPGNWQYTIRSGVT